MNCAITNADTLKIRDSDSNCAYKARLQETITLLLTPFLIRSNPR